ncbi:MAG TPA: porin family protein [Myxococcota bacterium]|nr:porin family protein [Myxococcota bacterium]
MRSLAISAALLAALCTANVARAGDDDPYNRPGGYLAVGASRSIEQITNTLSDAYSPLPAQVGDSWGANGRAGYRFNKFIATEVEYEWMKDFHMWVAHTDIGRLQIQTVTANLKVIAPYQAFQPYFLVGAGASFTTISSTTPGISPDIGNGTFSARFGAGLDYYLTKNISLNLGAEYVKGTAKVTAPGLLGLGSGRGLDYLSAQFGLGYRF